MLRAWHMREGPELKMAPLRFQNMAELEHLRHLSVPLWIFDLTHQRIWWANDLGLDFWGATSLQALTEREFSSDSAMVLDRLNTILKSIPQTGSFEDIWTLYPDGKPLSAVLSFQRAELEGNRVGLLIEVMKERDEDINNSAKRIAEAALATSSLMTMMSLEGRVLVQNPAALKCYGPPYAASAEQLDINVRFPDTEVRERILSCVSENRVLRFEAEVQTTTDMRTHYVWIRRGRDPVTGDLVIFINEEDITEISGLYRSQIERSAELENIVEHRTDRLRITQDRMRRGLQLAAIWDWDIETNQLFFSPNFVRLLGYEKEAFYDKLRTEGFQSILNPEDYAGYPEQLKDILANPDQPLSLEMRFITKSGQHLWIQIEGMCYCDDAGNPVSTAGLLTNITHKKQLEQKLIASQKLEAVGQLTGGIAHDFNNLLTVIQGNIQLLHEHGQADKDLTTEVVNAVQRGAELTRHMLAFAGKQTLAPKPLDIAQLLSGMRSTFLRVLIDSIEIRYEVDDALWPVFADAAQTENALLNIVLNARDAMAYGGELDIAAQNVMVDAANARFSMNLEPGEYVKISVSDNGSGMTHDVIAKAFDPFFTTKGLSNGSGLGLSMVLGFSQQSGGDAQIESAPDSGTKISIYLPRSKSAQINECPVVSKLPRLGNGERIHVLEDNMHVVSTVKRLAQSLGYNVTSSLNVADALDMVAYDPSIQLFLIDIILPEKRTGVDFASELLAIRPEAKVILMSGFSKQELARDIIQTLDFEFLPKPFSRTELANALVGAFAQSNTPGNP